MTIKICEFVLDDIIFYFQLLEWGVKGGGQNCKLRADIYWDYTDRSGALATTYLRPSPHLTWNWALNRCAEWRDWNRLKLASSDKLIHFLPSGSEQVSWCLGCSLGGHPSSLHWPGSYCFFFKLLSEAMTTYYFHSCTAVRPCVRACVTHLFLRNGWRYLNKTW
jgi:hypothetical protein